MSFTLPKQSQRSRSILQDGSRFFQLLWKENTLSYNSSYGKVKTTAKTVTIIRPPSLLCPYTPDDVAMILGCKITLRSVVYADTVVIILTCKTTKENTCS